MAPMSPALNIYQYATMLGQAGVGVYLLRHEGDVPDAAYRTVYTMLAALCVLLALLLEAGTATASRCGSASPASTRSCTLWCWHFPSSFSPCPQA